MGRIALLAASALLLVSASPVIASPEDVDRITDAVAPAMEAIRNTDVENFDRLLDEGLAALMATAPSAECVDHWVHSYAQLSSTQWLFSDDAPDDIAAVIATWGTVFPDDPMTSPSWLAAVTECMAS